jgi:hypothetical protein
MKGRNASLFTSCTSQNKLVNITNETNVHAEIINGVSSGNVVTILLRIFFLPALSCKSKLKNIQNYVPAILCVSEKVSLTQTQEQ